MAITLTDEEFASIEEAIEFANSGWTDDDVERLVLLEAKALESVRSARSRAGQPGSVPAS